MKKWTQQILANYPLIWNTRFYLMLPVLAILYCLSFLLGYFKRYSFTNIYHDRIEPEAGMFVFVILLSLLLSILWLVYYLRNNGLKSYYPTTTGKLFAEYLIILFTCVGLVSIIEPYRLGSYLKFNQTFNKADAIKDANTANLALSFLAFDFNDFYKTSNGSGQADAVTAIRNSDENTIPDSLTTEFSYLNYNNLAVQLYPESTDLLTAEQLNKTATRWLVEGKKDSVKQAINEYLKIVTKYGGGYQLNVNDHVNEIFSTNGFRVKHKIAKSANESGNGNYVETYRPDYAIQQIHETKHRAFFRDDSFIFLFFGIAASTIILSFRITKMRTWFIALIGSCIWAISFGLLGISFHSNGSGLLIIYFLLCVAFIVFSTWNIYARTSKTKAGIAFIWFQWALPSLFPMLMGLIKILLNDQNYTDGGYHKPYLEDWIDEHWALIWSMDVAFIIAATGLIILPLAKRWQAMPEE